MKIGILRETKTPPDRRVAFTPRQCRQIKATYPDIALVVQNSDFRSYSNQEYEREGIELQENIEDCDILFGIKEVNIPEIIANKTYLFFSHTAKEQTYNQKLLKALSKNKVTLIDYEYFTQKNKSRVVAFGRWAGIVGAYNGLKAYGERTKAFVLPPAHQLKGLNEMKEKMKSLDIKKISIVLTGGGRVAHGAVEILKSAGLHEVSTTEYIEGKSNDAIYCRLDPWHYTRHIHKQNFEFSHFMEHPGEYENTFLPYASQSDMYIACHFWDPNAPQILSREDLLKLQEKIKVIADISCDINGPIASTIRASTIERPVYGYNPVTGKESINPFSEDVITIMAVDNLPGELPRDASADFGAGLIDYVIPSMLGEDKDGIIERATILNNGKLSENFNYLKSYLES